MTDGVAGVGGNARNVRNEWSASEMGFMREALREAEKARLAGDVPVGAVVVYLPNGSVVARGHNTQEADGTALGHAELNALSDACRILGRWRLDDCCLYVTLEPCAMCAGAIRHARIPHVICGCKDPAAGAMGSIWSLHQHPLEKRRVEVEFGCCEEACQKILRDFFREQRTRHDPGDQTANATETATETETVPNGD